MGAKDRVEACGRCTMTAVAGLTEGGDGRDPFDGPRIELDRDELRSVSRHVEYLGRVKARLDRWMTRHTYGDLGR